MHPNKLSCAPIYFGPQEIRKAALIKLETLEALKLHRQWIGDSILFLNKDGSFSHKVTEEASFKARTQKASFFIANLFSSPGYKTSPKEQRLYVAQRQLLVSLLAHAWLWGRPKVLDNEGNYVAFEERQVLAPQNILDFLGRVQEGSCTYKETQKFLENAPAIFLHEDTSKWNIMGVIACLRWDKSHDLHDGGPWCSCRLERDRFPPPYHEVCLNKGPNLGVVRRFRHWLIHSNSKEEKRAGCESEMAKA
jgi:hypothetical protein